MVDRLVSPDCLVEALTALSSLEVMIWSRLRKPQAALEVRDERYGQVAEGLAQDVGICSKLRFFWWTTRSKEDKDLVRRLVAARPGLQARTGGRYEPIVLEDIR